MSEPTKEYGWRFLQPGEVIHEGDEFWSIGSGPWKNDPTLSIGDEFSSGYFQYRRRIDPGEGYEIVPAGTAQTRDMEYTEDCGKSWHDNGYSTTDRSVCSYPEVQAFRRRKTVQPQWPKPTFGRSSGPCLYWDSYHKAWFGIIGVSNEDVYWLPMPPDPTPKPPEKSDAEKAWDNTDRTLKEWGDIDSFIAGFNAAKKG